MIDKVFPKLLSLEQKVNAMQTHLNGINKVYNGRMNSLNNDMDDENADRGIKCDKCSTFIGFFDEDEEQFRFKYKGLVIYLNPGDDGYITIVCNKCSYANNLRYITCESEI